MFSSGLHLPSHEVQALAALQTALLAPSASGSLADYLLAQSRSIQKLLNADGAGVVLTHNNSTKLLSHQSQTNVGELYGQLFTSVDAKFQVHKRHTEMGVWNRKTVYGSALDEYQRTDYYQTFIHPGRFFSGTGMTLAQPGMPYCSLVFSKRTPLESNQQERWDKILHLLFPAFKAGASWHRHIGLRLEGIERVLDTLILPVALFKMTGKVVHQTQYLTNLLDAEQDSSLVVEHMQHTVQRIQTSQVERSPFQASDLIRHIQTRHNFYNLTACVLEEAFLGPTPFVLVLVRRVGVDLPSSSHIQHKWGLTQQEARVAELLCERLSNHEIAERLCISPHTARHHTEQVLGKLDIHSRKNVLQTLIK